MSDAARLARQAYLTKPAGVSYAHFQLGSVELTSINGSLSAAAAGSAYSAVISYAEALSGLPHGSISWSIIKLYYSCFYSLRALLLLNQVVPFNGGKEMLLDIDGKRFQKGGKSSHHWNWNSIRKVGTVSASWFASSDSEEAYGKLRKHRENVNYTHCFSDPNFHKCLESDVADLGKRFRIYRDDSEFLYTYLEDHLAIAYPTKLIFQLDSSFKGASLTLEDEKLDHVKSIWKLKDRCPCT
jgi:hypothetical protein